MKKILKKLMAVALVVVALSGVVTGAEKAEAATVNCKHGNYYNHLIDVRGGGYTHKVQLYSIRYDEYGNEYAVPDGYTYCTVSCQTEYWEIRCGYCCQRMGSFAYNPPSKHSICTDK
ncbi:MAG: hypothetical protein IKB07_01445 [Lachnospiraceae bacterium]|nr:hypothetical protein [Lachnospiraceae bacterium]